VTNFSTGITRNFKSPYYTGTASAALSMGAVGVFDVALNGIGYMLDLQHPAGMPFTLETIPMLHAMFLEDRGTTPIGEHSLTPYDYWRRSQDTWDGGGGQIFADHHDSVAGQYHTSLGVDPWTEGEFSMLHDTSSKLSSANSNLQIAVAGSYLYVLDGTALKYTADLTGTPSFTTVTATGGDSALSSAISIVSDGNLVYIADANRLHYTTKNTATFTKYHTSDQTGITLLAFAKGRLFTAVGRTLYTHSGTAGSAVATSYFQHPNTDWTWTAVAEGNDVIYFAGFSGHVSYVYSATIKPDGTGLDVPVVVATLPIGEIARSLIVYFDVAVIGTDTGFRAAVIGGSAGQLTIGKLVNIGHAVKTFEKQDRFIWFGWQNYDTTHTGLGRIDLSTFNQDVPAYATDLQAATQGVPTSVVTFQSIRVFALASVGIYAESTDKVATASLTTGLFNFELADPKRAIKTSIQYSVGAGSFTFALAVDGAAAQTIGNVVVTSAAAGNSVDITLPQVTGRLLEMSLTLSRSSTDHTAGPVIDRMTLMVEPVPQRRRMWSLPILLATEVIDRNGQRHGFEPVEEREKIHLLFESRQIVPFQTIEETFQVIIDDYNWVPYELVGKSEKDWAGTLLVKAKVID
jgi:hypothetical protein